MLYITQPALSLALRHLEEEIGVKVFERYSRNIRLNKYGLILLEHTNKIINEFDTLKQEIENLQQSELNRVVIASPAPALQLELVDKIFEINPNVTIDYVSLYTEGAMQKFLNGSIDLYISGSPIINDRVKNITLIEENMGILMPKTHLQADRNEISLAELKDEAFAAYSEDMPPRKVFDNFCKLLGFSPKVVFEGKSIRDSFSIVSSGRAIMCSPLWAIRIYERQNDNLKVIPLSEKEYKTTLTMSWIEDRPDRMAINSVQDAIINFYQNK